MVCIINHNARFSIILKARFHCPYRPDMQIIHRCLQKQIRLGFHIAVYATLGLAWAFRTTILHNFSAL